MLFNYIFYHLYKMYIDSRYQLYISLDENIYQLYIYVVDNEYQLLKGMILDYY